MRALLQTFFLRVILFEVIVLAALWVFGRYYS
jgi:hypothetical protein